MEYSPFGKVIPLREGSGDGGKKCCIGFWLVAGFSDPQRVRLFLTLLSHIDFPPQIVSGAVTPLAKLSNLTERGSGRLMKFCSL